MPILAIYSGGFSIPEPLVIRGASAESPHVLKAMSLNPDPSTDPSSPNPELEQELQALEQAFEEFRERYEQVKGDRQQQQSLQQQLQQIQQQLQDLELRLESQLFSWRELREPFWQALRFLGLGIVVGWILKSCAS